MRVLPKLLVFIVAISACLGATALPASATTTDESPVTATVDQTLVKAGIDLKMRENITLGKAEIMEELSAFAELLTGENGKAQGMRVKWVLGPGYPDRAVSVAVAYPLILDGERTGDWLQTRIFHSAMISPTNAEAACEVYPGKPGGPGAETPTWGSPFECVTTPKGTNQFDLAVGLVSRAEASGTIAPMGVALTDGVFKTDSSYHHSGAAQLATWQETRFDAILRDGDSPFYKNQARTEWAYQIVDEEAATGIWVAGLSTNHNGWSFSADGRCAIYDHNPLADGARLDDADSVENSGYRCWSSGVFVHTIDQGDRHFDALFSIAPTAP